MKFLIDIFQNSLYLKKLTIFEQIYCQILRAYAYIWPKNLGIKRPKRSILASKWGFERCLILIFIFFIPFFLKDAPNPSQKNLPPSAKHLFGTDDLGRDLLVRSLFGLRLSLTIACFAALIDLLFGASFGIIATIKGGLFEKSLFWFVDFLNCFPYLLISMTLTLCLGGGLLALIASLAAFGWMTQARTVRGVLQETLKQDYIVASTLLGTTPHQITYTHLLPHLKKPVLSTLSLHIPACIFSEAFLSFLGLGVKPPTASLGTMIQEGLPAMQYYPWRVAFPAALLTLTLFAFNLLSYKMEKELA